MSVSIVVPWCSDGAERDRNWAFLKARYETLFPDWEIVEGTCEEPWRKGRAVNAAVEASSGDVLVISDADVVIPPDAIRAAVDALDNLSWVVPFGKVYRLNEAATRALIADTLAPADALTHDHLEKQVYRSLPGGGMVVVKREDYDAAGGIDERFVGWGGEDISFAHALNALVGPFFRLGETLLHMHHESMLERQGGRAPQESETLAARYLLAQNNPISMRSLIQERYVAHDPA